MSNYPTSRFSFRTIENKPYVEYDAAKTKTLFAEDIQNLVAEIQAIEDTLGLDLANIKTLFGNIKMSGNNIGLAADSDLLALASGILTVNGQLIVISPVGNGLQIKPVSGDTALMYFYDSTTARYRMGYNSAYGFYLNYSPNSGRIFAFSNLGNALFQTDTSPDLLTIGRIRDTDGDVVYLKFFSDDNAYKKAAIAFVRNAGVTNGRGILQLCVDSNDDANNVSTGDAKMTILDTGNVGINEVSPDYKLDVNGSIGFTPGSSVTPVDIGDVVIEATSNTQLTLKLKGSDGTVRSVVLTLA